MAPQYDLVCLAHLRWDFVYQRPQHLLSRFARSRRVFYIEEPVGGADRPHLSSTLRECGVWVVVPHLPDDLSPDESDVALQGLLDRLFYEHAIDTHVLWYYTPMAVAWTRHLRPAAVVYDCMDELSAFNGASPQLRQREAELFSRANLVFTGGQSLYEAKRDHHPNVTLYPSSVDVNHFARARTPIADPPDQQDIPRPRLGFYGVVDERMDLDLLAGIADLRPDWQIVIVGPVVKIDPASLPRRDNIHFLGPKPYGQLPDYLAGWDVALLPFARNASTRFISPTKTPEYLAAGKPVVSTSITDVVRPYGERGLVAIADTPDATVAAVARVLESNSVSEAAGRTADADAFLSQTSWESTWHAMAAQVDAVVRRPIDRRMPSSEPVYLPASTYDRAAATWFDSTIEN